MIIYGWNSKLIKHAPLENIACDNCKEKTTHIGIHSSYVHIFWIPLFPYSKKASIVCSDCQHVKREKEMAPDFKATVKALKKTVPTPKYQFAGLGIILALVIYFTVESYYDKHLQQDYLDAPLAGDVYILKDNDEPSEYNYYLLKVVGQEEDSIVIAPNSFYYTGIPTALDPEDGFYDQTINMHHSRILEMHQKGELKKVIRDNKALAGFNRTLEYKIEEGITSEEELLSGE